MNIVKMKKEKKTEIYVKRTYLTVPVLGKNMVINIEYKNVKRIELDIQDNMINIKLPNKYKKEENVKIINSALEKMYKEIAQIEIENSMEKIRIILGFAPEDYKLKKMQKIYYRTYKNKKIEINPDIVKYSRSIIDNTVLKAFCRLKFNANTKEYKECMQKALKKLEIYNYNTKLIKVS